jgi:trimethylamine-N-oxide reductase cytochrome c-type subunit TorC
MRFIKLIKNISIRSAVYFGIGAITAIMALTAHNKGETYISSTEFCTGCHSMQAVYEELIESPHFQGRVGIDPECGDCHLPTNPFSRSIEHVVTGIEDMYNEYIVKSIQSKEDLDNNRSRLAHEARMKIYGWNSSPCKQCHKSPGTGGVVKRYHKGMDDNNCIRCHQNVVHAPVPKEDLSKF